MTRALRSQPLTATAFKPFGDVIEVRGAPESINHGYTQKFADLADIMASGGSVTAHIYRSTPPAYPFALRVIENHPLGSQMFVPLSGNPYLVVVAPKGPFDPNAIRAFAARPTQGARFTPCVGRDGPGETLEEVMLDGSILLEAP